MIATLEYILLAVVGFGILYTAAAVVLLYHRKRQARSVSAAQSIKPPVSILKPLKGIDEDLEANLRSFFELDYPRFELLFGINDIDDPAIALVQKLRRQFPDVPSRLVVTERRAGVNPKVNNLINIYPFARFDHLVISDSNVRVSPDYLSVLTAPMSDPKVGLVTSTVRGLGADSLGATLENLHLSTFVAYNVYAVLTFFRVPVTIGKSMLLRRQTLESLGGFAAFRDFLLEDGLIGKAVQRMGQSIVTTFHPVDNINRSWGVGRFVARHLRWAMMRRHLNLGHYVAELLSNPILFALIYALLDPTPSRFDLFVSVLGAKILLDMIAGTLTGARLPLSAYLLVPVKELLIAALWPLPFFQRTVVWRGNKFRIGALTRVHPVMEQSAEPDVTAG